MGHLDPVIDILRGIFKKAIKEALQPDDMVTLKNVFELLREIELPQPVEPCDSIDKCCGSSLGHQGLVGNVIVQDLFSETFDFSDPRSTMSSNDVFKIVNTTMPLSTHKIKGYLINHMKLKYSKNLTINGKRFVGFIGIKLKKKSTLPSETSTV